MTGDHINPIVVKELRQGLKSRSFLVSFIGLQLAMIISMFIYITSAVSRNGSLDTADGFFWTVLGLLLLLFMPLRSFQALHDEIKHKTLELIFLTRMTAWKIALGKWIAHSIQVLLMASAVLPYFVLRYFLGSINISLNLLVLGIILGLSLISIAIGVGLSAWQSKILRIVVMVGGGLFAWGMLGSFFAMRSFSRMGGGGSPSLGIDWVYFVVFVIGGIIGILFFVEYGASQIAPPAENHAAPKRLLGLVLAIVVAVFAVIEDEGVFMIMATMALGPFLCIPALCEPLYAIPTLYRKGKRFNFFKWFFYPGWPSGLLYNMVLLIFLGATAVIIESHDEDMLHFYIALFNAFFTPFVIVRLIPKLREKALVSFLALQLAGLLTGMMFLVLEDIQMISNSTLGFLGVVIPFLGLMLFESSSKWEAFFLGHTLVSGILIALSLKLIWPGLKTMKHLQEKLTDEPA